MTATTSPRSRVKSRLRVGDQLRENREAQQRQRDIEFSDLLAFILKEGVNQKTIGRIQETLQRTGRSEEDLQSAIDRLERRKSLVARMISVDRSEIKSLSDQIAAVEAEKQKSIDAFDGQIAPLQSQLNRLVRDHGRGQDAASSLLSTAPEWLQEEITTMNGRVNQLTRETSVKLLPVAGEDRVAWDHVDQQWVALIPGEAASEQSARDFNRRREEQREIAEALQPELEAAKARLAKLLNLAKQPWPTRADLDPVDSPAATTLAINATSAE